MINRQPVELILGMVSGKFLGLTVSQSG
jgi:hypothetical protein